ncbi:MAG: CRTAC1 family protein [Acidobacteriota bacterium]
MLICSFLLAALIQAEAVPQFTDVTAESGIQFTHISGENTSKRYLFEAKGGGAGFLDYDNDGWLDIVLVQGTTIEKFRKREYLSSRLYRNKRDGTFEDVTEEAGLEPKGWAMGVCVGDYNNDGFADIYLTQLAGNVLYKNNGNGTFTDVSAQAGVAGSSWSTSAAFADYDRDGDLDLYVANYLDLDLKNPPEPGSFPFCNYRGESSICGPMGLKAAANVLYRNDGDGTFSEVTETSGVNQENRYYSLGVVWADVDEDGDLDLFVANDTTPNQLFVNQGDGSFEEMGLLAGLATSGDGAFQASMGIDVADYDNDGKLDAFSTHFANDYSTLYHNLGNLLFEDVTARAGILQSEWLLVGWGTRFADFNHDGWKDIFHANGHVYPFLIKAGWSEEYAQPPSLYLNQQDGTFRDVGRQAGAALQKKMVGRGAAFGDYDRDGDIDILVANLNDSPQLLRNDSANENHWIMFKTRGRQSNRDGIGARITIKTAELEQVWEVKRTVGIYSSSDPRAHFGLARSAIVDRVQIRWPGGKVQEFRNVRAGKHYQLDEEEGIGQEPSLP